MHLPLVVPFGGDREDALNMVAMVRRLEGGEAEERSDRGQAKIACRHTGRATFLDIVEKPADKIRRSISHET
jgi:hypothetical protein